MRRPAIPCALTIAGSDSGGGAGIQADLKTFAALGVHGTSVLTCLTAQNPRMVKRIEPCSTRIVAEQLEAVFEELPPKALKTGMLYSEPIMATVVKFLRRHRPPRLVVDPVMISTSGTPLLQPAAAKSLLENFLPLAMLVTPNLSETAAMTRRSLKSVEDMRRAARELHGQFGCAALVKGGHLHGYREAIDIFYDGHEELLLSAPFVKGMLTHGTGCTYSAAITACLARGLALPEAVRRAKQYISEAIAESRRVGRHWVLGESKV